MAKIQPESIRNFEEDWWSRGGACFTRFGYADRIVQRLPPLSRGIGRSGYSGAHGHLYRGGEDGSYPAPTLAVLHGSDPPLLHARGPELRQDVGSPQSRLAGRHPATALQPDQGVGQFDPHELGEGQRRQGDFNLFGDRRSAALPLGRGLHVRKPLPPLTVHCFLVRRQGLALCQCGEAAGEDLAILLGHLGERVEDLADAVDPAAACPPFSGGELRLVHIGAP